MLSVTSGANPVSVKRGIDKTVQGLVEELEKTSRPVKGRDDIKGNAPLDLDFNFHKIIHLLKTNNLAHIVSCCYHFCWKR